MTIRDLIHWDRPFGVPVQYRNRLSRSLTSLQDEMNHLFANFWDDAASSFAGAPAFPAVDVIENDSDFKVRAELPGMAPENVEISVTDGFLTIKGEKKQDKEEKGENYLRRESSYGAFSRTISLPETANCEKAEATFKNGMVNVAIPKKAEAVQKPRKIEIKKAA